MGDSVVYNSLDIFRRSFLGSVIERYGRMKSRYVCIKMATSLDGKLYVKTFSMLYVDCINGRSCCVYRK